MDFKEAGHQKALQPDFMRSDKQFRAVESFTLHGTEKIIRDIVNKCVKKKWPDTSSKKLISMLE